MPLLARKFKTEDDRKLYTVDYDDWLDLGEELDDVNLEVDIGPATTTGMAISGDGKSFVFRLDGGDSAFETFNVLIEAITTLGQIKNDHIEVVIVPV